MAQLERLKARIPDLIGNSRDALLNELLDTAKEVILLRRYPFANSLPDDLEPKYLNLQVRIALDMYNKIGAEGEKAHSENGVTRTYGAQNISTDLLDEIVPKAGIL